VSIFLKNKHRSFSNFFMSIFRGMRFGQMQSKMAILKLIKNFKFTPCEDTLIPMKFETFAPFISPKGGMWLKVEKI